MSVTLFLGRHGETELNSENRLRGWIDEPLNAKGIEEAHDMAEAMSTMDIDRVYCSSLDRADHTAQIIAKRHGLIASLRDWFKPLNYGDLNGKSLAEIQPELNRLNKIWETNPDYQVPEGESFAEFQERNLRGLRAILENAEDGERIMIVAHLRNCLLFHGVALNEAPLEGEAIRQMDGKGWHQPSGSVSRFEYGAEQEGHLLRYVGIVFEPETENQKPLPQEGERILSETAVADRATVIQGGELQ